MWVKYLAILALLSFHTRTVEMLPTTTSIEKPSSTPGQFCRNNGQYSKNQYQEQAWNGRGRSPEGNRIERRHQQSQKLNSKREPKQKSPKQDDSGFIDRMRSDDVSSFPTWGDFSERYDEETEIESELYNNSPIFDRQKEFSDAVVNNQSSSSSGVGQSEQADVMTQGIPQHTKRHLFLQQWQLQSHGYHFLLMQTALVISFAVSIFLVSVLPANAKMILFSGQEKFHINLTKLTILTFTNLLPTLFLFTLATKHYPFAVWSGFINTFIWGIPLWLFSEYLFSTFTQTTLINSMQPELFLLKSSFPSVFIPWLRKSRLLLTPKTRQLCRIVVEVFAAPLAELLFIRHRIQVAMKKVEFDEQKKIEKKSSLLTAYFFIALTTAAAMKTFRAWITLCLSRQELPWSTLLLSCFNPTVDLCAVVMATAMWKKKRSADTVSKSEGGKKTAARSFGIKSLLVVFFLRAIAGVCGMKPLHYWITLINTNKSASMLTQYSSTLLLITEFSKVIWTAMMLVACVHVVHEISSSLPVQQPPANN